MGEPSQLAQFVESQYRKRCFSQKHPVVMFAVMPVLLLLGFWSGLGLLAYGVETLFDEPAELEQPTESVALSPTELLIGYGVIWIPVTLTTVIFCRAAQRRRVSWRWSMLTAATLAVFPGMTVRLSPSALVIGLLPVAFPLTALYQMMLPLAIGSWYSWRGYRLLKA